jgi:hypothetical protein
MRTTVDHQRRKFYNAEHIALAQHYEEYDQVILGYDEAATYLNHIKASWYYKKHNGCPNLQLAGFTEKRRVIGYYSHNDNSIYLDSNALTEINICHEVAHHLQFQISDDLPAHGPVFTTFYLGLLFTLNTEGFFSTLLNSFLELKVDYYQKRLEHDLLSDVATYSR